MKKTKAARPKVPNAKAKPEKTKKASPAFFSDTGRGARGTPRKQFHVLLSLEEHEQLIKLTHKLKMNATSVFRALLKKAAA